MQFNLLSWTPPCQIIVFPMKKRVGKIRRTAEILSGKNERAADAYWRQVCTAFLGHLDRLGVSEVDRKAAVRDFFDAVQSELVRLSYSDQQQSRPGGDAA
jgi:hypothetical protein